jgi:hypothetical protein
MEDPHANDPDYEATLAVSTIPPPYLPPYNPSSSGGGDRRRHHDNRPQYADRDSGRHAHAQSRPTPTPTNTIRPTLSTEVKQPTPITTVAPARTNSSLVEKSIYKYAQQSPRISWMSSPLVDFEPHELLLETVILLLLYYPTLRLTRQISALIASATLIWPKKLLIAKYPQSTIGTYSWCADALGGCKGQDAV